MTASSSNPPSSPRLPSPPPFAENQIEPSHPTLSGEPSSIASPPRNNKNITTNGSPFTKSNSSQSTSSPATFTANPVSFTTNNKYATVRRIRPGTKSADISTGPPLVPLAELDSAFQLQEHLASLLATRTNKATASANGNGTRPYPEHPDIQEHIVPLSRWDCETISSPPEGVDSKLWCYELTRRLTRDLNILVVALINDGCTSKSCPEMRAGEWQYLCAAHDQPQPCCAIEYITHTLDHAATVLCSTKYFPSRLSMTTSGSKQLSSIFRRLYRIFAHAWFQHRQVFWTVELEHGLYLFFKTTSEKYALIPEDTLTIPKEAEDIDGMLAEQKAIQEAYIAGRRNPNGRELQDFGSFGGEDDDSDSDDSDDLEQLEDQHEEGDLGNGNMDLENPFDDDSSSIDDESEDEDAQPHQELPVEEKTEEKEEVLEIELDSMSKEDVEKEDVTTKEVDEDPPKTVKAEITQEEKSVSAEEQKEPKLFPASEKTFFTEEEDAEDKREVDELLDSFLKSVKPEEETKQPPPALAENEKKESAENKKQETAEPTLPTAEDKEEEPSTKSETENHAETKEDGPKPAAPEKKEDEKEPEAKH